MEAVIQCCKNKKKTIIKRNFYGDYFKLNLHPQVYLTFFFYPKHPSFVGCSSCPHQNRPVVEKLSRSHRVGPQTLGAQCGTYFGASEEVRGVMNVCLAEWA